MRRNACALQAFPQARACTRTRLRLGCAHVRIRLYPGTHGRRRARGAPPHGARRHSHAHFHARGHRGLGQGRGARRPRGHRRAHHPRQYLPSLPAARRRARGPARRPAPLRLLAGRHPDGQRRLSGLQPEQPAQDPRGRRGVPLADRRLAAYVHAGIRGARPAQSPLRHHDGAGRMRALRRGLRLYGTLRRPDHALGGQGARRVAGGIRAEPALWHRSGRIFRGPAPPFGGRAPRAGL